MKTFIKIIIIVAILMVILTLILRCSGNSCVKRIDKTLPEISEAPWEVITPSHLYYAEFTERTGGNVVMKGWYERVKDKWVYHPEQIELPNRIYGNIKLNRR